MKNTIKVTSLITLVATAILAVNIGSASADFGREVEMEFYRILAQVVSQQGMRGREVASQTRKLAIRMGLDLREMTYLGLETKDYLSRIGPVSWSWRRGHTVRRLAFAPAELMEEAQKVVDVLNTAVAKRILATGRTVMRR